MTPRLTHEQDQAVRTHGSPCPVFGADNQTQYVIISSEQFEMYRQLFEQGPLTKDEQKAALIRNGQRIGWDAPEMSAYDDYDADRTTS